MISTILQKNHVSYLCLNQPPVSQLNIVLHVKNGL